MARQFNAVSRRCGYGLVAGCIGVMTLTSLPARADVVTDWNQTAQAALVDVKGYPRIRAETLSVIAMFNALNAIDTKYRFMARA